jgi:hypothetical protein
MSTQNSPRLADVLVQISNEMGLQNYTYIANIDPTLGNDLKVFNYTTAVAS